MLARRANAIFSVMIVWVSLLRSWWQRWTRPSPQFGHLHFVLYTRQGCHLCEVALRQLRAEQPRRGFVLQVIDIDTNPELVARYGEQVPVVTVNDKLRFRGAVNRVLLNRLFRAEGRFTSAHPGP